MGKTQSVSSDAGVYTTGVACFIVWKCCVIGTGSSLEETETGISHDSWIIPIAASVGVLIVVAALIVACRVCKREKRKEPDKRYACSYSTFICMSTSNLGYCFSICHTHYLSIV